MRKLLEVLHRLTDLGNTVIIIEHNLDVIRNADWIIDLGPEGGEDGGRIVAEGTPAQVAQVAGSHTASFPAPLFPVRTSLRDIARAAVQWVSERRMAGRRRAPAAVLLQSSNNSMPIDPSFLPPAASPEEFAVPADRVPVAPLGETPLLPATPNLAHTVVFAILSRSPASSSALSFSSSSCTLPRIMHESAEQMQTDPLVVIPVEALIYAVAGAASFSSFRFYGGVPSARASTGAPSSCAGTVWLLVGIGVATSVVVQLLSNFLPIPKELPIDKFFTHPLGVWLIAIFGVTWRRHSKSWPSAASCCPRSPAHGTG